MTSTHLRLTDMNDLFSLLSINQYLICTLRIEQLRINRFGILVYEIEF